MRSGAGSPRCALADRDVMGPQIVKPGTPAEEPEVRSVAAGRSLAVGEDERDADGWGARKASRCKTPNSDSPPMNASCASDEAC
jgi:hypothetical protein